jgi:NAD(P)H-flavin reductase
MLTDDFPLVASGPMAPKMYWIVARHQDLPDTVTFDLAPAGDKCDAPELGQFNMLWAFGIGEAPISIAAYRDGIFTHTVRDVGAVTSALCAAQVGEKVGVRGPFGQGWGLEKAKDRDILIVAGGLGLAPVRPIIAEVLGDRESYGQATLLVGAREPNQLLYRDELQEWSSHLDLDVYVTVDVAESSWRGNVGLVTRLIDRVELDGPNTTAYVCGPEIMMRFVAEKLLDHEVADDQVLVSLERNMHCGIGHCGHCQLGSSFMCKDGPVLPWSEVAPLLKVSDR